MKKIFILIGILIISSAHDMFIKLDSYFLKPSTQSELFVYNGTFEKSENSIDRIRMRNVSLFGPDFKIEPNESSWYDKENITCLKFKTGKPGTYVAGVSTNFNMIELTGDEFNEYLEHDGVLNVLEDRKKNKELNKPAKEKYAKYVKAIFQVGNKSSNDFAKTLDYPIEFIPIENPYTLNENETLHVRLLKDGEPLKNQLVYIGYQQDDHHHDSQSDHQHNEIKLKSNSKGVVSIQISEHGQWYIRTIDMVKSDEQGIGYESNWATLTFEIQ